MALQSRPDGKLVYVAGASRSGKTQWTAQQVRRDLRVLVWDAKDEWTHGHACRRITSIAELAQACRPDAPLERIAYVCEVDAKHFETFCRLAWVWVRAARGSLIVEELADVTHPGKAPPAWGQIIRKGLAYGPSIYALTQRPSESDKTALGNATLLHCHQMADASDEEYMAKKLRVPAEHVAALKPLQYIERCRLTHTNRHGTVTFRYAS